MSDGVAVEFDTPLNLYDNKDGVFYSLCERSGITREDILNAA
jgi:ABC-type multidrug transport system fused ATPase/permease subunit